ncbi:MAG: 2OG-Fe(II) oxygenase [Burkholderiales bacterium]|nr:2OG-Fe(II) oxygenase [Burkholderiales bacterium]
MSRASTPSTPTPELLRWLREQLDAGQARDDALAAMRASGWDDAVARAALAQVAQVAQADLAGDGAAATTRIPGPDLAAGASRLEVEGRPVQLLMTLRDPRLVVLGGFLADAECDALVALARPRLARSQTVDGATGGSEVHAARTSRGMFFERGETPLLRRIEQRIAALLRWPLEWGEPLQVLHYAPGAEYRPHHDYFDPRQPGAAAVLRRGGQRIGTLLMYLNTPEAGGATCFPDAGLEIAALKGCAVFFGYERPHPDTRTLHGATPVRRGEKWVATKWLRERAFR